MPSQANKILKIIKNVRDLNLRQGPSGLATTFVVVDNGNCLDLANNEFIFLAN